ncbi:MAG: acyltransferase family protein [Lachnospiraceae bacterium]|jgi:peptidoglycan/LPS O-acetylase OafA/YrhL
MKKTDQIEGLRAIACLMIVAGHCGFLHLEGHGGVPVTFFFALSGFLTAGPWREGYEKAFFSFKYIGSFYARRALRLLPAYYVILLTDAALSGSFSFEHLRGDLFFTVSTGHYWFLQQYLLLTVLAPAIMLIILFLKKVCGFGDIPAAVFLMTAAILIHAFVTRDVFYLMGNGMKQTFRLPEYMTGMAFAYLYKSLPKKVIKDGKLRWCVDGLSVLILAAGFLSSPFCLGLVRPEWADIHVGWTNTMECAVISCMLVLAILVNPDGIVSRFLRVPPLTFLGRISYQIYLIHFVLLMHFSLPNSLLNFTVNLSVSIVLSLVINFAVERPLSSLCSALRRT